MSRPTATITGGTTATLGANVTSGAFITARGTVWGVSAGPTTNPLAEGGTTTGLFSQTRSGLPAGTKIYYRGYATNSAGTAYSPDGSFHTEPATQAAGITFSEVGVTSLTVNWTRGDGDGVIVLMRQGTAVDSEPVDGTYSGYAPNSIFGTSTQIGAGNYLVYKGNGNSVTVSGLTSGTTYYLALHAYTGSEDTTGVNQGTNYKSLPATGSQTTSAGSGPYSYTFNYTGSLQTLAIPAGATGLQFTVKGAGGGGGRWDNIDNQENGQNGHAVVISSAVSGVILHIYVGGGGQAAPDGPPGAGGGWGYSSGGFGGDGEEYDFDCWAYGGAGGGGSSAILLSSDATLLAGAAGGAGGRSSDWEDYCYASGGSGGGGGGADFPGTTDPSGGGAAGAAGVAPTPGDNGQVTITYELVLPPTLGSPTATAIGSSTATLGAEVTADGGAVITERGTVWGISVNPTGNAEAEGGTAMGLFSQNRNGVPAGTKIYFRGYAINGAGTGYSPDGSFYSEPATQVSGLNFSSIGATGMTVNWTRGNGEGVIVLMRQSSPVDSAPVDGTYTGYAANPAFGSGTQIGVGNYVVYQGTASSVAVSGLSPGATYYLAAYEYQGSEDSSGPAQGSNYKASPATGSQATSGTVTFPVMHLANCYSGQITLEGNTIWAGPYLDQYDECDVDRTLLMFDTSALGPGATVASATLYLDYQNGDYLAQDAVTEVHESAWVFSTDIGNCSNVGAYLNDNTVTTGQSFGPTTFTINSAYINKTGSTLFAVKGADEGSCVNVDPGYNRATSYLEVQFTTN